MNTNQWQNVFVFNMAILYTQFVIYKHRQYGSNTNILEILGLMLKEMKTPEYDCDKWIKNVFDKRSIRSGELLCLTHYNSQLPKTAWQFLCNLVGKSKIEKLFEGEMLFRPSPTTLFQMFYKIFLNSKVIIKTTIDADDNFHMTF